MFRFTIRDVLWVTVAVALAVGWVNELRQTAPLRARCERLVELAQVSASVMRDAGLDAEFKSDNIAIGGYHFERPACSGNEP
jgi:hypothetical protein